MSEEKWDLTEDETAEIHELSDLEAAAAEALRIATVQCQRMFTLTRSRRREWWTKVYQRLGVNFGENLVSSPDAKSLRRETEDERKSRPAS